MSVDFLFKYVLLLMCKLCLLSVISLMIRKDKVLCVGKFFLRDFIVFLVVFGVFDLKNCFKEVVVEIEFDWYFVCVFLCVYMIVG